METKSDSLLSKVASFFRERGSDEDAQPSTKSSRAAESEASLKTQAKLKKRDDAIREREFKDLRSIIKTRRSAQGLTDQDPPRPSLSAPGSTLNASNRASTLQKINVAEAQLEQWWGGASSGARNAPANARPAASTASASAAAATAPAKPAPAPSAPPPPDEDFDLDFTDLTPLTKAATATASSPAQTPTPALRPAPAPAPAPALKPAAAPAPPQALDLSLDFTMDKPAPPQAAAAKPLLNTSSPAPAPDSIEFTLDFTMETPAATPAPAAPPVATPQASEALEFTLDFTMDEPAATSTLAAPAFTAEQATVIESAPASQIEECLRDAAICYSEGDFGKAEELLLTTLKGQRLDGSEIELLTFALFDVYRATGQQSLFEVTAMDYAEIGRASCRERVSSPV